jgi:hypothetical protein
MDLNELKSTWQNAGRERKSQLELQAMTKINNHPKVRRTKIKFIIEVILLVAFLAVYHDILDGASKPLWLNIMLVSSIILYIANDIIGYVTLLNLVKGHNVAKSLQNLKVKLWRILVVSLITSIGFAVALLLFLTFNIQFTTSKYALLAGMVLTMIIMISVSYKTWIGRVRHIHKSAEDFGENT